jgi:AcrR family transcriptional regulator
VARVPRGQETRQRVMAAALERFATRGYGAVSMEEIAEAAGVTKGAVYHWFSDKDDLGRELQHDLYERLSAATLQALSPADDVVTNMIRAFDAYLALLDDLGEARFFLRDAWVIPALDEAGRRDHEDAVGLVRAGLQHAIDRGALVDLDAEALARVVTGVFAEATLHVLRTGDRGGTERVVRHMLESLRVSEKEQVAG